MTPLFAPFSVYVPWRLQVATPHFSMLYIGPGLASRPFKTSQSMAVGLQQMHVKTFFSCQTAGKRRETFLSREELAASAGGSRCQSHSLQASHQQVGTELSHSGCNSLGQRAKTRHLILQTTQLNCLLTLQQSPGNRLFLGIP